MTTVQQSYKTSEINIPRTPITRKGSQKILLAVDEGLSILGKSAKQSIYFYLEKSYGIKKNDIPFMIEEFATALHNIFGPGSKIILIEILKKLYENERK
jgi:hypothetical protein